MRFPDIGMGLSLQSNKIMNNNNSSSPPVIAAAAAAAATEAPDSECTVREQDRFMPIANVIRIMRKILPPHAKISDDAKETIQECVSEYISFITGEANERCQREQRKTITAEDVLWAMSKLGFDDYIEPLTLYLHRHREFDGGERASLRGDPLGKRPVEHHPPPPAHQPYGPPPQFHFGQHPVGFFATAVPLNGFPNNNPSSNGRGPSSHTAALDNGEHALAQCKE